MISSLKTLTLEGGMCIEPLQKKQGIEHPGVDDHIVAEFGSQVFLDVLFVLLRQDDLAKACPAGRQDLLLDAANREDPTRQRDLFWSLFLLLWM